MERYYCNCIDLKWDRSTDMNGKLVYDMYCSNCHTFIGRYSRPGACTVLHCSYCGLAFTGRKGGRA